MSSIESIEEKLDRIIARFEWGCRENRRNGDRRQGREVVFASNEGYYFVYPDDCFGSLTDKATTFWRVGATFNPVRISKNRRSYKGLNDRRKS